VCGLILQYDIKAMIGESARNIHPGERHISSFVPILVPFLMILALGSSATPQVRTATLTKKEFTLTLEMTGVDHAPGDTVSALLRFRNNSSQQITIFDPALLYAKGVHSLSSRRRAVM